MSRAVTVGLGQRFRSQSKRISSRGEVCCRRSGLGGGSSANENCSLGFGIGCFLVLPGRPAIENEFIFGGVAHIYRNHDPIGGVAWSVGSDVGCCSKLARGFYAVTGARFVVSKYGAKHLGSARKFLCCCFASCVVIQHPTFAF